MALTVTSRGTGTHNTAAATLVPGGRTATLAVGSMGVLCLVLDNAGSGGNTPTAPASWTDAKGNVWTRRHNVVGDFGTANAGFEMAIYTAPITTALLTTDLGTITWSPAVSPVAKAWTWYEVIPSGTNTVEYQTSGGSTPATAANPSVTTASIAVGDAVIAGYFAESTNAVTGDSDTTNGTWAAQQTATIGTTTAGVRIATQQKVQITAASTQTYNPTVASADSMAAYIALREVLSARSGSFTLSHPHTTSASAKKGGAGGFAVGHAHTVAATGKKGALAGFAVSHGHTVADTGFKGGTDTLSVQHGQTITFTGTGVEIETHAGEFGLSHGHIVSASGFKGGQGVLAVEHGQSISVSGAKSAYGSFGVTGALSLAFDGRAGHQDQFGVEHATEVSFAGSGGHSGSWSVEHGHSLAFSGFGEGGLSPAADGEFALTHGHVVAFTGHRGASAEFALVLGHVVDFTGQKSGVQGAFSLAHGVALAFNGASSEDVSDGSGWVSSSGIDSPGSSSSIESRSASSVESYSRSSIEVEDGAY